MILVIKKGDKLEFVESWDYSKDNQEKHLHKLIDQNPQFIVRTEGESKHVLTVGSKTALPSGQLDLILVDSEGGLTLVELKRGRTPRRVIAQIFDYASSLYEIGLDEFEDRLNKFETLKEIFEEFQNHEQLPTPEFSLSDFKDKVKDSMKNPDLIIVSYDITEDIKRMADYLRGRGIPIACIEFEYFKKGENEFFIPKSRARA